jgi:hypothetical protein
MLDTENTKDLVKLSYAFRPLTKNNYAVKYGDGNVRILSKGKRLFPALLPFVTVNGSATGMKRAAYVSRVAMYLAECGVESYDRVPDNDDEWFFIPSACWRRLRPGILSTTRFAGMLFIGAHRLAVYDIGDGNMEWQLKAEHSLFYRKYGDYETRATGVLMLCDDEQRVEIAQRIIRTTMWKRKQLLNDKRTQERDRPVQYVKAPIRLAAYFERVYMTTPKLLSQSLDAICDEYDAIEHYRGNNARSGDPKHGDYEDYPTRYFFNATTDLLKYVYFFAAVKADIEFRTKVAAGELPFYGEYVNYAICLPRQDTAIAKMYDDVSNAEGSIYYEYICPENVQNDCTQN